MEAVPCVVRVNGSMHKQQPRLIFFRLEARAHALITFGGSGHGRGRGRGGGCGGGRGGGFCDPAKRRKRRRRSANDVGSWRPSASGATQMESARDARAIQRPIPVATQRKV